MPIDRPKLGKCNAQLGPNHYCGAPIEMGATSCRVHGGAQQLTAGLKESLYSKRLRQSFKKPEDQKLFEELPKSTDLGDEIRVARMQVIRYQEMLENGTDVIFAKEKQSSIAHAIASGDNVDISAPKAVALSVHDLLRDALANLRALAVSQDAIHPGSDIGGNLRLTITLAGASKPRLPIPDLTDDSNPQRLLPASGATIDVAHSRSAGDTGYEDDEP